MGDQQITSFSRFRTPDQPGPYDEPREHPGWHDIFSRECSDQGVYQFIYNFNAWYVLVGRSLPSSNYPGFSFYQARYGVDFFDKVIRNRLIEKVENHWWLKKMGARAFIDQFHLPPPTISLETTQREYRKWLRAGNCKTQEVYDDTNFPGGKIVMAQSVAIKPVATPAKDPNARRSMLASIDITTPPRTTPSMWNPLINAARLLVGGVGAPAFGGGTVGVMPVGVPSVVAPMPVMAR